MRRLPNSALRLYIFIVWGESYIFSYKTGSQVRALHYWPRQEVSVGCSATKNDARICFGVILGGFLQSVKKFTVSCERYRSPLSLLRRSILLHFIVWNAQHSPCDRTKIKYLIALEAQLRKLSGKWTATAMEGNRHRVTLFETEQ